MLNLVAGMIFYQGFPRWVIVLTGVEASAGIELMNSECIGRKKQEYSWYGLLRPSTFFCIVHTAPSCSGLEKIIKEENTASSKLVFPCFHGGIFLPVGNIRIHFCFT